MDNDKRRTATLAELESDPDCRLQADRMMIQLAHDAIGRLATHEVQLLDRCKACASSKTPITHRDRELLREVLDDKGLA